MTAGQRNRRVNDHPIGREAAPEFTAGRRLALDVQLCLVARQYVLDDGESKTYTAILPGTPAINAKETLGQAWNVLLRDSLARVKRINSRMETLLVVLLSCARNQAKQMR